MSTVTTSGTIVPGTGVTMRPLQPVPGLQLAAVMLQNLSGYQLAVNIGGDSFVLPPYMADVYVLPSVSPFVAFTPSNPQTSPTTLPAYVNATWFDATELPDPASYPTTIPAPAFAVGVAVAQQLLAQGVPSVLTSTVIFNGPVANLGSTPLLDVSAYGTITIICTSLSAIVDFYDTLGNILDEVTVLPAGGWGPQYRVSGPRAQVTNLGAAGTVTITGTNRVLATRTQLALRCETIDHWELTAAVVAGGTTLLNTLSSGTYLQGECYAYFRVSSAVPQGYFQVQDLSPGGTAMVLAETKDMTTSVRGGVSINTRIALPAFYGVTANGVSFHTSSGPAAGVTMEARFVQLNQ